MYSYAYTEALSSYMDELFRSICAIKLPISKAHSFFARAHKKNVLDTINKKFEHLSWEQKEDLIEEFLQLLPEEDTVRTYQNFGEESEKAEFVKFNELFSDLENQYKQLTPSEQKQVLKEALIQLESSIVKIKKGLASYAVESKDIAPYLVIDQLFEVCLTILNCIKPALKKRKFSKENQFLLQLLLITFLNMEAVRRGKKEVDSLYEALAVVTLFLNDELGRGHESIPAVYEVFNLA